MFDGKIFTVIPNSDVMGFGPYLIVFNLDNISWWAENIESVKRWCEDTVPGAVRFSGMTAEFDDEQSFILFCLRWSE